MRLVRVVCLSKIMEADMRGRTELAVRLSNDITVTNVNVFSTLTRMKKNIQKTNSDEYKPTIIKIDRAGYHVTINSKQISLGDLRLGYRKALERAEELLKKLLLGYDPDLKIDQIVDCITNTNPGYSMKSSSSDYQDEKFKNGLLAHVMDSANLRDRFFVQGDPCEVNGVTVQKYMALYDDFVKCLLYIIHVGGGMPSRASELATIQRVNLMGGMRNVYFTGSLVMILTT